VYEALRAEALGERCEPVVHPALRQRWRRLGLLGLLSDEEVVRSGAELSRRVVFEGAPARAGAWRLLVDVYAMLVERSVDHEFNTTTGDDKCAAASGDLRQGVVAASAAAGDHRLTGS